MTALPGSTVTTTDTACELMTEHGEKLEDDYDTFKSPAVIEGCAAAITTTANRAYRLIDIVEEPGDEYEVVDNPPDDPCRRNDVTARPPSTKPLSSIPLSLATPTSGNVGGARQEDV